MVKKHECLVAGKSLKNMKYPAVFAQLCDILATISPHMYRKFCALFTGPTDQALRHLRSRAPKFALGFNVANIDAVVKIIHDLQYHGPVTLSYDDTELEKALSVYEVSKEFLQVVGNVGEPLRVDREDDIDTLFTTVEKASKLCVWVLGIPLPKIPPIVITAVPRSGKEGVSKLFEYHTLIMDSFHSRHITPLSMSSDGAATECSLGKQIITSHEHHMHHHIAGPTKKSSIDLVIPLCSCHRRPSNVVQDAKHGAKTARNQLLTGAHLLVLGNFTAFFAHLRDIAEHVLGSLFRRDVEKLDRQDDRAASRTLSSATLGFLGQHFPQRRSLATYLFIMGELINMWQNQSIGRLECACMVLRARLLLTEWHSHISQHPDYSVDVQFISRDSYEIFITMCDSLLSLILSHRQFYPNYPLLPWLHSRKLKKDFTQLDFLHFIPELHVMLLGEFSNLSSQEKANATAAGYHHTYFHSDDINIPALMEWPTHAQLEFTLASALEDVKELLSTLGINFAPSPTQVVPRDANSGTAPLPAINPPESDSSIGDDDKVTAPSLEELLHTVPDQSDGQAQSFGQTRISQQWLSGFACDFYMHYKHIISTWL
ncbi:hypothetical protein HWV62_33948 [Athelia sp. TMB]|nr:hypothetical protein HWV62_33948 [Athelia sp. TMB]